KHIIIISDGDPSPPQQKLMQQILAAKISISTVSVYPHQGMVPPTMQQIAQQTGGRFYGPIEKNPNQLPQIFIKEATVVRRTLLQESKNPPIAVEPANKASEFIMFLIIRGTVVDPEGKQYDVRLVQCGAGTSVADYPITMPGNYVVALRYASADNKQGSWLISGLAVNDSPET